jgi:hypothetical protein
MSITESYSYLSGDPGGRKRPSIRRLISGVSGFHQFVVKLLTTITFMGCTGNLKKIPGCGRMRDAGCNGKNAWISQGRPEWLM